MEPRPQKDLPPRGSEDRGSRDKGSRLDNEKTNATVKENARNPSKYQYVRNLCSTPFVLCPVSVPPARTARNHWPAMRNGGAISSGSRNRVVGHSSSHFTDRGGYPAFRVSKPVVSLVIAKSRPCAIYIYIYIYICIYVCIFSVCVAGNLSRCGGRVGTRVVNWFALRREKNEERIIDRGCWPPRKTSPTFFSILVPNLVLASAMLMIWSPGNDTSQSSLLRVFLIARKSVWKFVENSVNYFVKLSRKMLIHMDIHSLHTNTFYVCLT